MKDFEMTEAQLKADSTKADEKLRGKFIELKINCPSKALILTRH